MSYEIKLEVFEGPLDLLLHLIHRNEVSITDIPIALITQQYLETIELMKSLNLDVAGEYLVMAAYLTHIKSRMLLPVDDEGDSEEKGEDPRDELVAHLLEYKRYREAAENLSERLLLDRDVFSREAQEDSAELPKSQQPLSVGLNELLAAFRDITARTSRRDLIEVEPERLLVKDKIREILDLLQTQPWITFGSLFERDVSRINILTTFLALLETVKLQLVRVYQDQPFGTILISRRVSVEDGEDSSGPCEP
ncbi:MAG: segregation/condensation protein A [Pseudomonadota bacterium]